MNPATCANCGANFEGTFCPTCGQRIDDPTKVTIGEFVRDSFHEIFDLDSKFVTTVRALLFAPGKLTRDYIDGHRELYVKPVRLYLIVSALFFLLGYKAYNDSEMMLQQMKQHQQFAEVLQLPEEEQKRRLDRWLDATGDITAYARFGSVVGFAVVIAIAFFRRRLPFVQHLIFALHYYAFDFLFYAIGAIPVAIYRVVNGHPPSLAVVFSTFPVLVVYLYLALRRAYGSSVPAALAVTIIGFIGDVILSSLASGIGIGFGFYASR